MTFPNQIAKDRGQPATIRIGQVLSVDPTTVSIQGVILADVGFVCDYAPRVGDNVAVAGQSAISTDGSSWLVLGSVCSGVSTSPETRVLAVTMREAMFDSPTYTVAAGEQLIGSNINITVPLLAGHLIGLHMTFLQANTTGAAALTRVRLREDSLVGAQVVERSFVPGAGNAYYAGRLDGWIMPANTQSQLYVVTTQALIGGVGQWGFATTDTIMAVDYGLASLVNVV